MAKKRLPVSMLTTSQSDKFVLRMPDGLRDSLKIEAAKNGRSMNAEMIARLERSFEAEREALDWKTFERFLRDEEQHLKEKYFTGLSDNPSNPDAGGTPETALVGMFSRLINRRTELAMKTIVRELEKRKLLAPTARPVRLKKEEREK
jgi:hypothetical protein